VIPQATSEESEKKIMSRSATAAATIRIPAICINLDIRNPPYGACLA